MTRRRTWAGVGLCFAWIAADLPVVGAQQIDVVNNQPFEISMPVQVRGVKLPGGATAAQQVKEDAVVVVTAPAGASVQVPLDVPANVRMRSRVELKPAESAIGIAFDGQHLGNLSWGIIARPIEPKGPRTKEKALDTKGDFAGPFKPLPLAFKKTGEGPVFETWSAGASGAGLKLDVELLAYRAGFLDVSARYTNESAPTQDVYAAIVCRWEQPGLAKRLLCYDNKPADFADGAFTSFRHGEGRHLYIQRGVDWINASYSGGASALWLKDFTPNFTTHHGPRDSKTGPIGPRWLGANTAQVAQEAQAKDDAVYSISEIARPNLAGYAARLADNVLPPPGEGLAITSRMVFSDSAISEQRADEHFIAYTGYNPQEKTSNGAKVTFGVPFARFGTNYFPYSTLGENFVTLKQAGMSKEGYWPLAPETVKQYKLFADDIKRDLRIAKAMGFELIRLHHVELLWDKDPATGKPYITEQQRNEYLDFYFNELKHLGLKALLDIKVSPEETAKFVERYRDLIDGVEIDNEVLIFQTFDADVQYWKDVYAAVKRVAPDMPVHLTTHTNTGAFDRLSALGVPYDRVGAHAYMDSLEAINSGKNYGLAIADYATKANKPPLITEWNWRFLTRMTPEARAKVYRPIFENLLKPRSMPMVYQFQFNDSLAMNPLTLKGIRHYEQLNLSRRPKPEAMEMVKLIQEYSDPAGATRLIGVNRPVVELKDGSGAAEFTITNHGDKPIKCSARPEAPAGVVATLGHSPQMTLLLELKPGESVTYPMAISLPKEAKPGFYHVFLRLEGGDGFVRYGWAEARHAVAPKIGPSTNDQVVYSGDALLFDFNRPLAVVYPVEASVLELEAAWVIYQTLESATGRVVDIYQSNDLPADVKHLIWVGRGKASAPTVSREGERLIVSGKDEQEVTRAAMDLTLRYWQTAKDSGASKVGLVKEATGKGGVKTDLD